MTRVLVLTSLYPPHHYGGLELSCRDVVERWRRAGHEVTVLTSDERVPGAAEGQGGDGGVRRELRLYWRDHRILSPPLWARLRVERANQRALAAALTAARPGVVSAWGMGGMSLGLLTTLAERGVPVVHVCCDEWPVYGPRVDAWSRLFAGRPRLAALARRVAGVPAGLGDLGAAATWCFVSDAVGRAVRAGAPGWTFPRTAVVHSGIDTGDFPLAPQPPAADARPWRWRLLGVGRLDERKGFDVAVAALAHLPPAATLDLVGPDAGHRAALERAALAAGAGGRVRFSVAARAQLAAVYRDADVCVFPSRWEEPFGLVPLEAMACGTPVVATATGGAAEYLDDGGNCLVVPVGDAGALAAAVTRLAGDSGLRARLLAGGRATAARFTAEALARVLEAWHTAAATGYAAGEPGPRQPPRS